MGPVFYEEGPFSFIHHVTWVYNAADLWEAGSCFDIKMPSYQYRNFHYKNKVLFQYKAALLPVQEFPL